MQNVLTIDSMSVGSNVRRIRKAKGLTLDKVAAKIGTDTGNLSRLERDIQSYTDAGLRKLARVLGVEVTQFFVDEPPAENSLTAPITGRVVSIPTYNATASMGLGTSVPEQETVIGNLQLAESWVRRHVTYSAIENLAVISAYGDSMAPTFNDSDILLVDTGVKAVDVDGVFVLRANNRLYVKRVRQRLGDGTYIVSSDNPTAGTPEELSGKKQIDVMGRVVWAWNGKKL